MVEWLIIATFFHELSNLKEKKYEEVGRNKMSGTGDFSSEEDEKVGVFHWYDMRLSHPSNPCMLCCTWCHGRFGCSENVVIRPESGFVNMGHNVYHQAPVRVHHIKCDLLYESTLLNLDKQDVIWQHTNIGPLIVCVDPLGPSQNPQK
jgi:hypothetical protein